VVFESIEDLHARIRRREPRHDEHCIMVLKGCGPKGYPGMGKSATCRCRPNYCGVASPNPAHLRCAHERHGVWRRGAARVARSRGGGPLALVRNGDLIDVDVPARRLHLDVSDTELAARGRPAGGAPAAPRRGCTSCTSITFRQAHLGADLDVLVGGSGSDVSRDSH